MKHLFRGKRVDNGEWMEGYHIEDIENNKAYIFDKNYASIKSGMFSCYYEVISESVGMWIQKIDGNKNKIFVGDICKIYGGDYGDDIVVVVFENGKFLKKCGSVVIQFSDYYELNNIEVIGNITDNPEMVGKK
jgi:hypothetical protein